MGRPQKERGVTEPPRIQSFKPTGVPRQVLERVSLTIDEFEAIRLADHQGLDHEHAAEKMNISRTTFTRLIEKARRKIADALIEVKELYIEGGSVHFRRNIFRCGNCGKLIRMNIGDPSPRKCPQCGSINLIDLAQTYGHGPCCRRRGRGGRDGF